MVPNNFIQVTVDTLSKMTSYYTNCRLCTTEAVFGANILATAFTLVAPPAHFFLQDSIYY